MSAVFSAKYHGQCLECYERIEPGESITLVGDDVVHARCTSPIVDPLTPSRTEPYCGSCFTFHAGECA